MKEFDVNLIKDDIAREVVAAIIAEPMVMKYSWDFKDTIILWRNEVEIKMQTGRYTKKAFERILMRNPHLFKTTYYSKQFGMQTLEYADQLKARMRKREQEHLAQKQQTNIATL